MMDNVPTRFRSRKFLVALLGQITGLAVLIVGPEHAETVEQVAQNAGALILMALTGLGYILAEGKVDSERAKKPDAEKQAAGIGLHNEATRSPLWALALLAPAALLLGGCNTIQAEPARLFVDSVGAEYLSYVETGLSPEQVQQIVDEPTEAAAAVAAPDFDATAIATRRTFVHDFRDYVHRAGEGSRLFPVLPAAAETQRPPEDAHAGQPLNESGADDERNHEPRGPDQ